MVSPQQTPVVRARCKPGRRPSLEGMEIVVLADGSAICVYADDRVRWFPSIGTLLAAHDLEWNDVRVAS